MNAFMFQVQMAARYGGHDLKLDPGFTFGETDRSPDFLAKFPQVWKCHV